MDQAAISDGIRRLAEACGVVGDVEVSGLQKLQGGNSSEMWAFDGIWLDDGTVASRPLILRTGMGNEFALGGRGAEFTLLKALEGSGLPIPRVFWFDSEGTFIGRPAMVMERCGGVADRFVMTERNKLGLSVNDRVALGRQMMDLLAQLHSTSLPAGPAGGARQTSEQLREHDDAITRFEAEPCVELRVASWWLWRHLPPEPDHHTIVHGDYRPANMLLEDGRVSAILDWEFVHIGDPLEDLGWFLTPYYAAEHLVADGFSAEDAIKHYEAARGIKIDRATVKFWTVFAMFKLAYMTVAALRWLTEGDASRMAASAEFIIHPLLKAIGEPGAPGRIAL